MKSIISDIIHAMTNTSRLDKLESDISNLQNILLDRTRERSERRKDLLVNFIVTASAGILVALFSIWFTTNSHKKYLDSLIDINFGVQDGIGRIPISTDTVKIYVDNIGPNDVQDIRISLITFHANILTFDKIELDNGWPSMPLCVIKKLKVGEKFIISLQRNEYNWETPFINDENPKLNAQRTKESQLFCRLSAKFSRSRDNKPFYVSSIYKIYRNLVLPWNLPMSKETFMPDNRL